MKEIILDTETTGLEVKEGHRIVEIGCIELDNQIEFNDIDSIEWKDKVKEIERKMLNYAKELQFEKAALLRDQLEKLKTHTPLNNVV